jgi:hypothetical protein
LSAPIINAGRLGAGRDHSEAAREESLANYQQTIINTFASVELELYVRILAVAVRQGLKFEGRKFDLQAHDAPRRRRKTG